jgi:hypothetical protein
VVDAFGWARFGALWNRYDKVMFVAIIRDMESLAGIGDTRQLSNAPAQRKSYSVWGKKMKSDYWGNR